MGAGDKIRALEVGQSVEVIGQASKVNSLCRYYGMRLNRAYRVRHVTALTYRITRLPDDQNSARLVAQAEAVLSALRPGDPHLEFLPTEPWLRVVPRVSAVLERRAKYRLIYGRYTQETKPRSGIIRTYLHCEWADDPRVVDAAKRRGRALLDRKTGPRSVVPYHELEVGQSCTTPPEYRSSIGSLRAALNAYGKRHGMKFSTKVSEVDGPGDGFVRTVTTITRVA